MFLRQCIETLMYLREVKNVCISVRQFIQETAKYQSSSRPIRIGWVFSTRDKNIFARPQKYFRLFFSIYLFLSIVHIYLYVLCFYSILLL